MIVCDQDHDYKTACVVTSLHIHVDKLLDNASSLISSAMLSVNQFDYPECEQIAHQLKDLFKENELEFISTFFNL